LNYNPARAAKDTLTEGRKRGADCFPVKPDVCNPAQIRSRCPRADRAVAHDLRNAADLVGPTAEREMTP
jgi:hypothetical protein